MCVCVCACARVCVCVCVMVQQTKVYQHSCHNTTEASLKVAKSREKLDATKGPAQRRKKAEDKYKEVRYQLGGVHGEVRHQLG